MKRAALSFLLALAASLNAQDDLTVLKPLADGTTPDAAFENWLLKDFAKLTAERSAKLTRAIPSKAACSKWQEERRAFFLDRIGGLPERTPLNPKITGTLQGPGYRVEKILLATSTSPRHPPRGPPFWCRADTATTAKLWPNTNSSPACSHATAWPLCATTPSAKANATNCSRKRMIAPPSKMRPK
jgi:hypothetical protein